MITLKERTIHVGQRVQVYYNLHKGGYSIKDKASGLVVGYADSVLLTNCKFTVQQGGRKKTIAEQRKRVHAFIEGDFQASDSQMNIHNMQKVIYNPYTTEQFTVVKTGTFILESPQVFCVDKVCFAE